MTGGDDESEDESGDEQQKKKGTVNDGASPSSESGEDNAAAFKAPVGVPRKGSKPSSSNAGMPIRSFRCSAASAVYHSLSPEQSFSSMFCR